jgi:hypothetical protein
MLPTRSARAARGPFGVLEQMLDDRVNIHRSTITSEP